MVATQKTDLVEHIVLIYTWAARNRLERVLPKNYNLISKYKSVQANIKGESGVSALGIALENFPDNSKVRERRSAAMKWLLAEVAAAFE